MLKNELRRALFNKRFWILVIVGLFFLFYISYRDAWGGCVRLSDDITAEQLEQLRDTYWNSSLVWKSGFLFYKDFFPFFIVVPFLYSYTAEKVNKSAYMMIIRAGKKKYYASKFLATGISGSLVIMIPEIVYTIIVYSVFRDTKVPDWVFDSKFFFAGTELEPSVAGRVIICLLIHMVFTFSYAILAMGLSSFFKNRIGVYLGSYLIYLFAEILLSCNEMTAKYMSMGIYWCTVFDTDILRALLIMFGMICVGIGAFCVHEKIEEKLG